MYRCLRRAGLIEPDSRRRRRKEWKRWERGRPNELWQMDTVGGFLIAAYFFRPTSSGLLLRFPLSPALFRRYHRVQPWRAETFKFSTDPELVAKVTDVVGLYLHPLENAIVLSIDEKSQIQALDRTQKTLPMQPGKAERRTHDYVRHGTTTLFATLEIATGQVTGLCKPRHRHQEFLVFLRHLARGYPDQPLHLIMDNYAAHKHPKVKAWLAANPRIQVHFTPTSGSWLNLVEVWFGIIERQAIHRGIFASVRDLMIKIRASPDSRMAITGFYDAAKASQVVSWQRGRPAVKAIGFICPVRAKMLRILLIDYWGPNIMAATGSAPGLSLREPSFPSASSAARASV